MSNTKAISTQHGTTYICKIKAHQARNHDGTMAGWQQGTPEGDRDVIQKKFVPLDPSLPTTYTNQW